MNGTDTSAKYCCNAVAVKNNELGCSTVNKTYQEPFMIESYGELIFGVAALSGYTNTSTNGSITATNNTADTTADDGDDGTKIAIGVGVGVPLGVISLLAIGWALWERRKRKRAALSAAQTPVWLSNGGYSNHTQNTNSQYTGELTASPPKPAELSSNSPR